MKPKRQLVPSVTWIVAALLGLLLLAIFFTWLMEVRSGGHVRSVHSMNLRQIGQAALMYAMENDGRLPETNLGPDGIPTEGETTSVHRYAMALSRKSDLTSIGVFISPIDRHPGVHQDLRNRPIARGRQTNEANAVNPDFLESGISYQLIGGLAMDSPTTTPLAITRGLREDGTWDSDNGVYGTDGGYIVFLAGNIRWSRDLISEFGQLQDLAGAPTANILETLSPDHAIYGDPEPPIADGTRGVGARVEDRGR